MKKLYFLLIILLTCSVEIFAQQEKDVHKMDSAVLVQTGRIQIPFSAKNRDIILLKKEEIEALPVRSVGELLSYVAGVDVRRRGVMGTQVDIGINGGTFDQTLILLNGIKIIDPQTGHNMMNLPISLDDIKRIEILKGPAASAYGVNAINGAINIITVQPEQTTLNAHAFVGSSFQNDTASQKLYTNKGFQASAAISNKHSNHYLSLSRIESNGYRHNTDINNNKLFYSNNIKFGGNTINMMGGFIYNDFGANGFYAAPNDIESREKVQTGIAAIDAQVRVTDFWLLQPTLSYRYNFDDYMLIQQDPKFYENKHFTNTADATLKNSFFTSLGVFGLGLEYRTADINSSNFGKHNRSNVGFFGSYSKQITADLLINIGLYSNYNKDFDWDWMPSIDIGYQLSKSLRIFANAETGMRLPTYTDLYYKGPVNIGNDELKPEKARQASLGVKYNNKLFSSSASYFYRNISDMIDWVKDSLPEPWHTQNYQDVITQGISFSANYQIIPQNSSHYNALFGLSYTWLNPELRKGQQADEQGKISHYALENLRNQLVTYAKLGLFKYFELSLTGKYQQRVNYKDYFLFSARLSAHINQFQFYIDGMNLTDVQYVEAGAVPIPGTWFTLGVKWHWQKQKELHSSEK